MTTPDSTFPESVLRPGTMVYDVHGDPENPEDTGTIFSVQEGGYSVVWTGDFTPKYAAADEVAALPGQGDTAPFPEHPDDVAAEGHRLRNYISCPSHCCAAHGCKYRLKGCPVVTGLVVQDYPCEQCTYMLDDAARYTGVGYSRPGEIGFEVTLGLRREDESMADLPTAEQVNAAVAEAIVGLNLNGWTLTRVLNTEPAASGPDDEDDDE